MGPIDCPEKPVTPYLRCVTSQTSKYLVYTAAEAWYHELVLNQRAVKLLLVFRLLKVFSSFLAIKRYGKN
jgi:hypothetical protein